MTARTAIVTVGGIGQRLGHYAPKSLLMANGRPMVCHVVDGLRRAGIDRFVFCSNRPEWWPTLQGLTLGLNVQMLENRGVTSTIELLRQAIPLCEEGDVLFAYGHAPRPHQHLVRLQQAGGSVAATGVRATSKRVPIRGTRGLWLEPPYRISWAAARACAAESWGAFLSECSTTILPLEGDAPGEFNDRRELAEFRRYLAGWAPVAP